jgi:hypothetical protein
MQVVNGDGGQRVGGSIQSVGDHKTAFRSLQSKMHVTFRTCKTLAAILTKNTNEVSCTSTSKENLMPKNILWPQNANPHQVVHPRH